MQNKSKWNRARCLRTTSKRLADKMGYFGSTMIMPNFLRAVIKIHLGGHVTPPITLHFCGTPDAAARKLFNITKPQKSKYA